MTRCPRQVDVGAYVLDVLEPHERERMQRHLVSCPACSADRDDLAALPTRLAAVPADDVLRARQQVARGGLALRRSRDVAAGELRRRRRARAAIVVTALAVVALAGGVVVLGSRDDPSQPDVVTAEAGAVHASAALTATRNGTRVVLTLGGVPAKEQCRLVALGRSGQRQTASTWTATYHGEASVTGWLSMRPDDIDRLLIETLDGTTLLTFPSPHR